MQLARSRGSSVVVSTGFASDEADLTDCFNGLEASASDTIDGGAEVDFVADAETGEVLDAGGVIAGEVHPPQRQRCSSRPG